MSATHRFAAPGAALALAAATAASAGVTTVRLIDSPSTDFPLFATAEILNQVPFLGGMEVVETRLSWSIQTNDGFDISDSTYTLIGPIDQGAGPGTEVAFEATDFGHSGEGFFEFDVTTDAFNGVVVNDAVIPGGGKERGSSGFPEDTPAALFRFRIEGRESTPLGDPPYGFLRSLIVDIDVREVPSRGPAALLGLAGCAAVRRRR